uniref:Uncharacterized protein n=1 Tax=Arundo donax TaxID=35708 RepID=A0A0A9DBB3_ARUDO
MCTCARNARRGSNGKETAGN